MNPNQETPIEVISRHEPLSDRMKSYATEKASKLLRFHNRISRIQIVLDGTHDAPFLEMIVHVDSGATLVAREHQEHLKRGLDLLADKMERQLKKASGKLKHHKGEGPRQQDPGGQPGMDAEETYDDAVRKDLDS